MRIRALALCCILLTGCQFAAEDRPVVAVALTGHRSKLDDAQVQALFSATTREVEAAGFHGFAGPAGYTPTFERRYGAGFNLYPHFGCTVEFERLRGLIRFYEFAQPSGSGHYSASEAQRRAIRELAARIANYLRRNVPAGFEVEVGIDFPIL